MTTWTPEELGAVGEADELHIAPARTDGSFRRPIPIWVVRVGDGLYVRSYRGPDGGWYRQALRSGRARIEAGGVDREVAVTEPTTDVDTEIDEAYRAKYGRWSSYVLPMIAPPAVASTLRLEPAEPRTPAPHPTDPEEIS
ncbi:DUF2255 family protein [Isoptericola sediminis]|uniref:DUF2255 family protein n=1 Tax=Isoptericola sediminis TaxID=2733572 RepID=A0A849K4W5_9MICO|nr:DUF2255 family protein [Isoptericola sediminis]NNU27079.1 DUF2255 family protein [Isoptericola sediminis]